MNAFLNRNRPPVYCPGCSHEKITGALAEALEKSNIPRHQVVIVSDIGCSGLFDTAFNTHAVHGLHGRALTYAAGIKLAAPQTRVIVTMGDGGLGIGGAHFLAACRRNLDLTLIILNNFNFGMTGGQCSVCTPQDARTGSGFLNNAEAPLDVSRMAQGAGAGYVDRCSALDDALADKLLSAISHNGFSIIETLGMCTGRFMKHNRVNKELLTTLDQQLTPAAGPVRENSRPEYGQMYRKLAQGQKMPSPPVSFPEKEPDPDFIPGRILLLGSAGMRIITAGEIACYAGMCAGFHASLKNDYNITVLRGQSVSEVIISPEKILYSGTGNPDVIAVLSNDGVERRKQIFEGLSSQCLVIKSPEAVVPETDATVVEINFEALGIKKAEQALACLAIFARQKAVMNLEKLYEALKLKVSAAHLDAAMKTIKKTNDIQLL